MPAQKQNGYSVVEHPAPGDAPPSKANGHVKGATQGAMRYKRFVPSLPKKFVMKSDVRLAKATIFSPEFVNSQASVGIIVGHAASGKTAIAIGLVQDAEVAAAFADGVIWLHCGPQRTVAALLTSLLAQVQAVQDQNSPFSVPHFVAHHRSISALTNELLIRLSQKEHLLVLDDVWDVEIVRACKSLGLHCLVTTSNVSFSRALRVVAVMPSDQKAHGSLIREHSVRVVTQSSAKALLSTSFDCSALEPELLEGLYAVVGRLPLEFCLLSLLLQLVQISLSLDAKALLVAVTKKLQSSHEQLQARLQNEAAASHLSKSHIYCWRTIAVSLAVLPNSYRQYVLDLAQLPAGMHASQAHLEYLWGVPSKELPGVIDMFERLRILMPLTTVDGPHWYVCNLAREYLVYWVKLSNAAPAVGFQKRLLSDWRALPALCAPFSATAHLPLLESSVREVEIASILRSAGAAVDEPLEAAARAIAAAPEVTRATAHAALVVSAALQATQSYAPALQLLRLAQRWYDSASPRSDAATAQLRYSEAAVLLASGHPKDAVAVLEQLLKAVKASDQFGPCAVEQVYEGLIEGAYALRDAPRIVWFADARCMHVHEKFGPSPRYVHAMIERTQAQMYVKVSPQVIMQSIKATQKIMDELDTKFNLLHIRLKMCAIAYKLSMGRYTEVQIMLCHMFRRVQTLYDAQHQTVIALMNDIGICLNLQGSFKDALDILTEAAGMVKGPRSAEALQISLAVHSNLAVSMLGVGDARGAVAVVRKVLHTLKTVSNTGMSMQPSMYAWATTLMQLNELDSAKEVLLGLVFHYTSKEERSLVATSSVLETLGLLSIIAGDLTDAEHSLQESLQVSKLLQQECPARQLNEVETAKPCYLLSHVYRMLDDPDKAKLYEAAFNELTEKYKGHPFLKWTESMSAWEDIVLHKRSPGSPVHTRPAARAHKPRVLLSDPELPPHNASE